MGGITDFIFGSDAEEVGQAQTRGNEWLERMLQPMLQQAIQRGMGGQQLYPTAGVPQTPTAQGYTAQGYNAPQMPFSSPMDYLQRGEMRTAQNILEQFGGGGGSSPTAGPSGMFQANAERMAGDLSTGAMGRYMNALLPYSQMQGQASMFGAGAQNQAAQFGAGAQNQMTALGYGGQLQGMGAQNQAFGQLWPAYSGMTARN